MFMSQRSTNCIISHLYTWNTCRTAEYIFKKSEFENFMEICKPICYHLNWKIWTALHNDLQTTGVCAHGCGCGCVRVIFWNLLKHLTFIVLKHIWSKSGAEAKHILCPQHIFHKYYICKIIIKNGYHAHTSESTH